MDCVDAKRAGMLAISIIAFILIMLIPALVLVGVIILFVKKV